MPARRALAAMLLAPAAARAQAPAAEPARPPLPALPLPAGVTALPGGGWRFAFAPGAAAPGAAQAAAAQEMGRLLATATSGRVTLWAEVSEGEDVSATRRLALQRALALRAALVAAGLPETRVDIRALGRTPAARDVVDLLPPGVARP
ncbi:MAG: hypothetical protein MUC64_08445 [Rubritepida sp.]|jgi:hypothetical protein|nr:hypothetical protein [Rubritepida sp.]